VRDALERFRRGWEALDLEAVLSTVARRDDVVVYGTDFPERWVGYRALVEPFRAQMRAFGAPRYRWREGDPRIWVASEAAWACGELSVSVDAGTGRVSVDLRSTFVLAREAGGWKIVHAHFSVGQAVPVVAYS
jgi:ketosteroid isomerase-like protein